MIKIRISREALDDLNEGFQFYEIQEAGLGEYFSSQIRADIDGLKITAGIHRQPYRDLHRLLSRKFPYSIFYQFKETHVIIVAVIDCRRDPKWITSHLNQTLP
jgi:plasmid stabilization system protein ParE